MTLYVGNDHRVEVTGLKDDDGNVITGATVTATVYESDGTTEVSGVTWPITLSDEGSGTYGGTLSTDADIKENTRYIVNIKAVSGNTEALWRQNEPAIRRSFNQ